MTLKEKILNRLNKESETKSYTKEEIEKIKKDAVSEYLNSDEFNKEIDSVVKELGEKWYETYKKENELKNEKNDKIESILKTEQKIKDKEEYEKFLKDNDIEGYGQEPDIVKRVELAKNSREIK